MGFLDGYRVLDLTDERGLLAGRMLADLGADVVQVEPPSGSTARARVPLSPDGGSYVWATYAANKRGVALDPDTADGQEAIRDLAAAADIVIESEGPAVQSRRGLDHPDLAARNERLVYVSITAFGRTGPKSGYHDADLVVWAAGGPLDPHRDGDRPPVRISLPQAFLHAAADAAAGALLAVLARARTGRGQLVDVSAQAGMGTATLGTALTHAVGDRPRDPGTGRVDQSGSGTATDPALKKWPCRDGLIEFHLGIGPAVGGFTAAFFQWMADEGHPVQRFADLDWRTVPKLLASGDLTDADIEEARTAAGAFLAGKTKDEVLTAARDRKLLCVPIYDTADLRTNAQLAARDFYVRVGEGPREVLLPGPYAKVSADAFAVRRPAPRIGEHTGEVRSEWAEARR